jgi:hypothetical protein
MSNTSRRALLAGLSVAPVALAPALPAIAAPNPDAELFALVDRWQAHVVRCRAADETMSAAEKRTNYPDLPETIYEQERDVDLFYLTRADGHYSGRRWYWPGGEGARYFREFASEPFRPGSRAAEQVGRAKEITAAIAAYEADKGSAEQASGYAVAKAEWERLNAHRYELEREILLLPARTIAGVLRKVLLLADIYPGEEFQDITALLSEGIKRADGVVSDETIAFGLARDLLSLLHNGGANV